MCDSKNWRKPNQRCHLIGFNPSVRHCEDRKQYYREWYEFKSKTDPDFKKRRAQAQNERRWAKGGSKRKPARVLTPEMKKAIAKRAYDKLMSTPEGRARASAYRKAYYNKHKTEIFAIRMKRFAERLNDPNDHFAEYRKLSSRIQSAEKRGNADLAKALRAERSNLCEQARQKRALQKAESAA